MIVRAPLWRGTAIVPGYRRGLGTTGPAFDCAGNPAPAGTVTQIDPLSGACVSIPAISGDVAAAGSALANAASDLFSTAGGYVAPSIFNTLGSPTAQSSQTTLLIAVAAAFGVLLFMGGRR